MKLGRTTLQDLLTKKLQFDSLHNKYLVSSQGFPEVKNIKSLVDNNICSIFQLIDRFKNIRDPYNEPALYVLLDCDEIFENFIESNLLTPDSIQYLLNKIDDSLEIEQLSSNFSLLSYLSNTLPIHKLIDFFNNITDESNPDHDEQAPSCLHLFLNQNKLFKHLFDQNKLSLSDLNYILNSINDGPALAALCLNSALTKKILDEFLIDRHLYIRYDEIMTNSTYCMNIATAEDLFDLIRFQEVEINSSKRPRYSDYLTILEESLFLNNKLYAFNITPNQRKQIAQILNTNKTALKRLNKILKNHLTQNYTFDALQNYLTKTEKLNLLNI